MYRADVIELVKENPAVHGMFDAPGETLRQVFCTVGSVGMSETYEARSVGLSPEYRFELRVAEDYQGERLLIYRGVRYKIIRSYMSGDGIELYAERVTDDV